MDGSDALLFGVACDVLVEAAKRSCVESTVQVHPVSVIQSFTDVREVFQSDHWGVELAGDGLLRHPFDNLCECVLGVIQSFVDPPLGGRSCSRWRVVNISLRGCRA